VRGASAQALLREQRGRREARWGPLPRTRVLVAVHVIRLVVLEVGHELLLRDDRKQLPSQRNHVQHNAVRTGSWEFGPQSIEFEDESRGMQRRGKRETGWAGETAGPARSTGTHAFRHAWPCGSGRELPGARRGGAGPLVDGAERRGRKTGWCARALAGVVAVLACQIYQSHAGAAACTHDVCARAFASVTLQPKLPRAGRSAEVPAHSTRSWCGRRW